MTPIQYAVALGCNTAKRLAIDRDCSRRYAADQLMAEYKEGLLQGYRQLDKPGKPWIYSIPWTVSLYY